MSDFLKLGFDEKGREVQIEKLTLSADGIMSFPSLQSLGVKNGCTLMNYGNMSAKLVLSEDPSEKMAWLKRYEELFSRLSLSKSDLAEFSEKSLFAYMGTEHTNCVRYLDQEIARVLEESLRRTLPDSNVIPLMLYCDGFVTKMRNFPMVIAPADCAAVCITGIDTKGERFIIFLHVAVKSDICGITRSGFAMARQYWQFNPSACDVFIFPFALGNDFVKPDILLTYPKLFPLKDPEWENFIKIENGSLAVDFVGKFVEDILELGVKQEKIRVSDLNTIDAYKENMLYSAAAAKEVKPDEADHRFAVCVSL